MNNPPDPILLSLYRLGRIRGVRVEQRQVGIGTTQTFITLHGVVGDAEFLLCDVKKYLSFTPGHNYACKVGTEHAKQVMLWLHKEQEANKEFEEYQRLKRKFES